MSIPEMCTISIYKDRSVFKILFEVYRGGRGERKKERRGKGGRGGWRGERGGHTLICSGNACHLYL